MRLPRRPARALPGARRRRPVHLGRAGARPPASHERYAREWLEQQAVAGILEVDDPAAGRRAPLPAARGPPRGPARRRPASTSWRRWRSWSSPAPGPSTRCSRRSAPASGVPYADYGADLHEGQARFNRPMFDTLLARSGSRRCRTSTSGCAPIRRRASPTSPAALGWSSVAIARAYPKVRVDGIDLDEASIAGARRTLPGSGVEDRVTFHCARRRRPGARRPLRPRHDLRGAARHVPPGRGAARGARPARRRRLACSSPTSGSPRRFARDAGDESSASYYGFSVLHCLPVGHGRRRPGRAPAR